MLKTSTVYLLSLHLLFISESAVALHEDDFPPGLAIALNHETVNSSVNYSPNTQDGGLATPILRPRYQSQGFTLSYAPNRQSRFSVAMQKRQMNSLRDEFAIDEFSLDVERRFNTDRNSRYALGLGLNARFNHAPEIYKNSYTAYADQLITEVRLVEPRDARLSIRADLGVSLSQHIKMNVALSGGLSQTRQSKVVGSARLDNDCQYAFAASGQGGSLNQVNRCGSLISFNQYYPTDEALNEKLGFSVSKDLTYRDYFLGSNLSLHWQKGAWSTRAGYEFRQYFRPSLDHRIRLAGDLPVTRNHTAFAGASVSILRHWRLDVQAKYQHAAFLDDVPFLYTALTHKRYRGNGVIRYAITMTHFFH